MRTLTEWESKAALGRRLPRPKEALTASCEEALAFARTVNGPVVAKASGVAHKTDNGLVRTGLDAEQLSANWDELAKAGDGTVLVAEQITPDYELIAGGLRDYQFGPLVSIGLGGVAAEIFQDTAFMLAPPEPGELETAMSRLRGAPLLLGYRGKPPVDRVALQLIVRAIAKLLVRDKFVIEIDCNPILVRDGKPLVADALVIKK